MAKSNVVEVLGRDAITDPLTELLRAAQLTNRVYRRKPAQVSVLERPPKQD
jgi:hypothetical protein